jgi:hypothetical protein
MYFFTDPSIIEGTTKSLKETGQVDKGVTKLLFPFICRVITTVSFRLFG